MDGRHSGESEPEGLMSKERESGRDTEAEKESERKRDCTCPGCDSLLNLWRAAVNRQWKLQQM